jgi:hypothetical protein
VHGSLPQRNSLYPDDARLPTERRQESGVRRQGSGARTTRQLWRRMACSDMNRKSLYGCMLMHERSTTRQGRGGSREACASTHPRGQNGTIWHAIHRASRS